MWSRKKSDNLQIKNKEVVMSSKRHPLSTKKPFTLVSIVVIFGINASYFLFKFEFQYYMDFYPLPSPDEVTMG